MTRENIILAAASPHSAADTPVDQFTWISPKADKNDEYICEDVVIITAD